MPTKTKPFFTVAPHGALHVVSGEEVGDKEVRPFVNRLFTIIDSHAPTGKRANSITLTGLELISLAAWTNQSQIDELIAKPREGGLVPPDQACPNCGERGCNRLVWLDDQRVVCSTCGRHYEPPAAPPPGKEG